MKTNWQEQLKELLNCDIKSLYPLARTIKRELHFYVGPTNSGKTYKAMTELKKANPRYGQYYKNVTRSEITGPNEVTFYFDVKNNRELPFIVGELIVFGLVKTNRLTLNVGG